MRECSFLSTFDLRAIEIFQKINNFDSWFVGGCVRDALLGKIFTDYDIATVAKPNDLIPIFKNQYQIDLKGIAFGSIRVNNNGLWVDITTLRQDINSDGRHTEVRFTEDLATDASRRDFTINALYWNVKITDFFYGQNDLHSQIVRFIGDADKKIQDDFLRILRFFRFSAIYGKHIDHIAVTACSKHKQGLQYLSGKRVWLEWSKMLFQQNTENVFKLIYDNDIDTVLFGAKLNINILNRYKGKDHLLFTKLLLPEIKVQHLAHRLNLSNHQKEWIEEADSLKMNHDFRESFLKYAEKTKDLVYYWAVKFNLNPEIELKKPFWEKLNPIFPITGKDLLILGCITGPVVGSYLKCTKSWWVENNFTPDKKECLSYVKSIIKQ